MHCKELESVLEAEGLGQLSEEQQRALWGSQEFYRVHSAVNGGRKLENELFEGLR